MTLFRLLRRALRWWFGPVPGTDPVDHHYQKTTW